MIEKIKRFFNTIRYLRFGQLYWRIIRPINFTKISKKNLPKLRKTQLSLKQTLAKKTYWSLNNTLSCLNETIDLSHANVWNNTKISRLSLYNLHYFDCLQAHNALQYSSDLSYLIDRWVKENPIKEGAAWEAYPISLRIVNWIKWQLSGNVLSESALNSLVLQTRYLMCRLEYHLLGNHLLANAKALIFAGLFFQGEEAEKWLKKGLDIYRKQLPEQMLADGAHFELSPMYHAIILEDLLDLINIAQVYHYSYRLDFSKYIVKMFAWLEAMIHPDGDLAFFNDTTLGVSASYKELYAYAKCLNLSVNKIDQCELLDLKESGYFRLRKNKAILLIDAAAIGPDYLPGHAHADSLSFELSLDQQRILVNSGISTYAEGDLRLRQRGTASHNTVVVDQHNSSEVWKSFRVAKRARIVQRTYVNNKDAIEVTAAHNGYYCSTNKFIHQRSWSLSNNQLLITDKFSGKGQHILEWNYHFYPGLIIKKISDHCFQILSDESQYIATLSFSQETECYLIEGVYYPGFSLEKKNGLIKIILKKDLPAEFNLLLKWEEGKIN